MKATVKWFRKIRTANKIFGLEFFDLILLLAVFLLVFTFSVNLVLNTALVLGAYVFLRFYKNHKPPHWTGSIAAFLVRPKRYPMARETEKEIFE